MISKRYRDFTNYKEITNSLGKRLFVKPSNQGSSVGTSVVSTEEEFQSAIDLAFNFSNKIMIEEFVEAREIECSILNRNGIIISPLGEIITNKADYYSYDSKYTKSDGFDIELPANIDSYTYNKIQDYAVLIFKKLGLNDFCRMDFFLTKSGGILFNEINTLPGMMNISMFPKMWEHEGIDYTSLINIIINSAIDNEKET